MKIPSTLTATEARKKLFEILEDVSTPGVYYTLTEKGVPKAVILSAEEFDSLIETIEILQDRTLMNKIKKAEAEIKRGEYYTWEEVKESLGFENRSELMFRDKSGKKYQTKIKKKIK